MEERPAVQVPVVVIDAQHAREEQALRDQRGVAEQRRVGAPVERRGVQREQRRRRIDGDLRVALLARRDEGLVARVDVVCQPQRLRAGLRLRLPRVVADLVLLPDHHGRVEVVDDEGELGGTGTPVGGAEHRAELRGRKQQLVDPEAVVPEPQDAIAGRDALTRQRACELVHPIVELAISEPNLAVAECETIGAGPAVLAEHVAERECVQLVLLVQGASPRDRRGTAAAAV